MWSYETWLLRPDGSYEVDITYTELIETLELDGFIECGHNTSIQESHKTKRLINTIDVLGRNTTPQKSFNIEIYDDGTVEKKYLIK